MSASTEAWTILRAWTSFLSLHQRDIPVTVVDDVAYQVLCAFFSGGVLLGDVPEAVVASFDVEFLEDVAGTVDVEVAALNVCGEAHVHIRVVAFLESGILLGIPSDFRNGLGLPSAPVANASAKDVGNAP